MKLGRFTLHYLRGGNTNIDGGAMFGVVPKPLWTKKYKVNDKNQIHTPTLSYKMLTFDFNGDL